MKQSGVCDNSIDKRFFDCYNQNDFFIVLYRVDKNFSANMKYDSCSVFELKNGCDSLGLPQFFVL